MKQLLLALALLPVALNAKDWTVNVSYYGPEFSVQSTDWTGFNTLTDTVTYKVDGPGTLFIEDDFGTVYASRTGAVKLAGLQMIGERMRCSLVTPDGELLGWKADPNDAMGGDTPGDHLAKRHAWWGMLTALLSLM